MPRTRNPYPQEFRDQIVALARAGRSVESLAREFEPCTATIHGWIKQAEADAGERSNVLTSEEREELRRLRRENKQPAPGARYPLKGRGLVCSERRDILAVFEFMKANQAMFPIAVMARALGASRSGFHAWTGRTPSWCWR